VRYGREPWLAARSTPPGAAPAAQLRLDGPDRDPRREAALGQVQLLVVKRACDPVLASLATASSLQSIGARGELELWGRPPR